MKISYVSSLLLFLLLMLVVGQRAKNKKTRQAKLLVRLTYMVSLTVLASALASFVSSESVALLMQTVHYASTEWVLILLMAFLEEYVYGFKGIQFARIIVYLCSAASSVMLFLNAVFHHVVYCEYRMAKGVTYRMFRTIMPWYGVHMYFSYAIAALALLTLIVATVRTTAFYRGKYYPAVIALVITMGVEGLCTARDALMDYALFGYVGLAIFLIYYSVYRVNNRLITRTLSLVTTEAAGGVVCFDIAGKCIYANDIAFSLYKAAKEISDFETIFAKYEYGEKQQNKKWTESFGIKGERKYFETSYGRLEDDKNEYIGCFFYLYDKTEDVLNLEEARYQLTHDELTGIYNDVGFKQGVEKMREDFPDTELYIVTADIKDFKLINDLFGYKTGDQVLKTIANTMKESLPENSVCCRKSSDHFYFCIRKEEFEEERAISWNNSVSNILTQHDYEFMMHFGVYQIKKEDNDVSIMCDYARMAMHRIKDNYEKHIEYFDMSMMEDTLRVKELVRNFDEALENNQFKMFLQPQVRPDGKVVGAEALVRWENKEQGIIKPGDFIPVFEDVGLIYKLDQYIWEQAAKKLKEWIGTDRENYHISVNISTKDFRYINVYDAFVSLIKKYEISPKHLKLEITESAFMNDPENQLVLIEKLQAYGFDVEIDDFGSGYSSLNILKDMKTNVLKIDMGFLRKTKEMERSRTILNSIISMAKNLNMEVILEGVEEAEQIDFLTKAGCDLFQGYYFDRPIPVAEFERKY